MSGPSRRFDPSELRTPGETEPSDAESASALAAARELEALAASDLARPSDGFEGRIMAAIATEPAPRAVVRPGSTVRGGRPAAFLLAVRDAWGVAAGGGRPIAVRAQALAFVLLVVVAVGSLAAAGAVTVGGMLNGNPGPTPPLEVPPTAAPTPLAAPTVTPTPTTLAEPTETDGPAVTAEPTETAEPDATAKPAQTAKPAETAKPGETPRATRTPRPTETPEPGETPDPTETDGGGGDGGGGGHGPG